MFECVNVNRVEANASKMFTIKFLPVFIGSLFIMETKQYSIISNTVNDCTHTGIMCDKSYTLDVQTCSCIANESINDGNSVRKRRLSDKVFVSKLIRNDEFVMQASNDRCRNDEQWNGSECIPLISLCPGGYHWNGHACIIQVLTKTAALVPTRPDKKCALHAKINAQTQNSLPLIVMPTYSTSPMCPFGFIWSNNKCIRNPPTCPAQYIFHENLCQLIGSSPAPSPSNIIETTSQPFYSDRVNGSNKWQQKPTNMELKETLEHEIENSAAELSMDYNNNDQNHQHCCKIMSPRICRRIPHYRDEQWQCYHHQYRRCGEFCTKPNLFLRPKKTVFVDPLLIMPPPPRRLQKLLQNLAHREINIGKQ